MARYFQLFCMNSLSAGKKMSSSPTDSMSYSINWVIFKIIKLKSSFSLSTLHVRQRHLMVIPCFASNSMILEVNKPKQ
jgi:hypothetical protein